MLFCVACLYKCFFLLPFYQLEAIWPFPSDITRIFTQRTLAHWIFSHFIPVNPEDGCAGDSVQEQVYLIKRLLNVWSMNLQDYAVVCAMFLDCIDFLFVFLCIYFNEYYFACLHFISFDDSVFNEWWKVFIHSSQSWSAWLTIHVLTNVRKDLIVFCRGESVIWKMPQLFSELH